MRRAGTRLRITAQLVDGPTGEHIWAKNFDGSVEDIFDVQDRITEQVAGTIHPKIEHAEVARARRKRPDRLDAYDLYLQSIPKQRLRHVSENEKACRILTRAVELDPHFGPALADLAFARDARISMGWQPFTHEDRERAVAYARRAIAEAAGDARVLATLAIVPCIAARITIKRCGSA